MTVKRFAPEFCWLGWFGGVLLLDWLIEGVKAEPEFLFGMIMGGLAMSVYRDVGKS